MVLNKTDRILEHSLSRYDEESAVDESQGAEDEKPEEITILDEAATFESFTVWGHESLPDEKDNPFSKGVAEWVRFAEAVS